MLKNSKLFAFERILANANVFVITALNISLRELLTASEENFSSFFLNLIKKFSFLLWFLFLALKKS